MADTAAVADAFMRLKVSPLSVRQLAGRPALIELGGDRLSLAMELQGAGAKRTMAVAMSLDDHGSVAVDEFVDSHMRAGRLVVGHASMDAGRDGEAAKMVDLLRSSTCGLWSAACPANSPGLDDVNVGEFRVRHVVDPCQYGRVSNVPTAVVFSSAEMHDAFTPLARACPGVDACAAAVYTKNMRTREHLTSTKVEEGHGVPTQLALAMVGTLKMAANNFANKVADLMETRHAADPELRSSMVLSTTYSAFLNNTGQQQEVAHKDIVLGPRRSLLTTLWDNKPRVRRARGSSKVLGVADMRDVKPVEFATVTPTRYCMRLADVQALVLDSPESLLLSCVPNWDEWDKPRDPLDYVFVRPLAADAKYYRPHADDCGHVEVAEAANGDDGGLDWTVEGVSIVTCKGPTDYTRRYMLVREVLADAMDTMGVRAFLRSLATAPR
jgi:hypothetical protein